jgi:hypothetical protein
MGVRPQTPRLLDLAAAHAIDEEQLPNVLLRGGVAIWPDGQSAPTPARDQPHRTPEASRRLFLARSARIVQAGRPEERRPSAPATAYKSI